MLDLVADGAFHERHEGASTPWSEVSPEDVGRLFPDGPGPHAPDVASAIAISCATCGTVFRQAWTWERGYETWTITTTA